MICFYHADADGRCSGHLVNAMSAKELWSDPSGSQFVEMNYGKPFPFSLIDRNEHVYIVDYSIEPEEMTKLLTITKNVVWIDHHKTAIEKYKYFPEVIRGIRKDGIAACMLTYAYFSTILNEDFCVIPKTINLEYCNHAPQYIKLIADWDIWAFKYADRTRYFHIAMDSYDFSPESNEWGMFNNGCLEDDYFVNHLIDMGKTMTQFRDGWAKQYLFQKGFEVNIEGHKAFAVNLGLCNSEYFNSVSDKGYEIYAPFSFDGTIWSVSLYSETVDVSEIARRHGGGGHKKASGYITYEIPFQKTEREGK